ncbi:hypothetical protein Bca52824_037583 [Brassica carinata]|uniref:Uncharacterized protein n=1 Tax=Brassica carinata TaxID=52824 RepID=A0A8X7RKW4_BRACI|nr:hypothetical protein Bca52824_037583 [Brassica carinata]
MMNTKKIIKMAKKWQQRAALHRRRISFHRSNTSSSTAVEKGCFVVYTADHKRFAFPLRYLKEFGLSAGGPITLPFDSLIVEYLIKLVERRMDGDTEKALLIVNPISGARCSSLNCSLELQQQLHVF